jgi:hypothetical protein
MDPVTETPSDPELHLLTDWGSQGTRTRWQSGRGLGAGAYRTPTLLGTLPDNVFKAPPRLVEHQR